MQINFFKYQGTGNDFVMIDNRQNLLSKNDTNLISKLCERKFGVGADGVIFLEAPVEKGTDFHMVYFNADGKESTMCGNGGRCIVAFAAHLGVIQQRTVFSAVDGQHEAEVQNDLVRLKMVDVPEIQIKENALFVHTGSPHHVIFTEGIDGIELQTEGASIRYAAQYEAIGGANVNFAEVTSAQNLRVRTYERGVEDETLSCGTGVTAVALAANALGKTNETDLQIQTRGGNLHVAFSRVGGGFENIWLSGPATFVFKGVFSW